MLIAGQGKGPQLRMSNIGGLLDNFDLDTTAMTLSAALGFMALHEDFQEEMYEEVMSIMPTEGEFVSPTERTWTQHPPDNITS